MADGLNIEEQTFFQWVVHLHRQDRAGFADELLNISLLDTIESADGVAIQSLYWLAGDPSQYRAVTAHPTLVDGITDHDAKVIVVLHGVNRNNPLMRARFNLS